MPYSDKQKKAANNKQYRADNADKLRDYQREYMRTYRQRMDADQQKLVREQNRVRKVLKRAEIAQIVQAHKGKPCVDCGIQLPAAVMEFDHVRGVKSFTIASWEKAKLDKATRLEQILDEIAKCDIRCPNCHKLRHYNERIGAPGSE